MHSHWVRPAQTVLDPMVPPEGMPALEPAPERIVLTNRHHLRHAERFAERFGPLPILCHESGLHEFSDGGPEVGAFSFGEEVAPGITAHEMAAICPDDTALHIDVDDGVLALADAVIRWNGDLAFVPDFLMGDDPGAVKRGIVASIKRLLDLRFDHLLFAHGEPWIGGGRAALRAFAQEPRSAQFG